MIRQEAMPTVATVDDSLHVCSAERSPASGKNKKC